MMPTQKFFGKNLAPRLNKNPLDNTDRFDKFMPCCEDIKERLKKQKKMFSRKVSLAILRHFC